MTRLAALILVSFLTMITMPTNIAWATNWGMSEASILLPLPQTEAERIALLKTSDLGAGGPLVPLFAIAALPAVMESLKNDQVLSDFARVVAIRLDPCFREGFFAPPSTPDCRRQIRLVWQPLIERAGKIEARDAALHTFYDLTPEQWRAFVADYDRLRIRFALTPSQILVPHPIAAAQGLQGPYWVALKTLLLRYCGAASLTRVTMMSLGFNENSWDFRGWNVRGQRLEKISIPNLRVSAQSVSTQALGELEFQMAIAPFARSEATLWLIDNSSLALNRRTTAEFQQIAREQSALEDPARENPGTTDCASCHLAGPILQWNRRHFPDWDWNALTNDLTPASRVTTDRLRAFGYFRGSPVISSRVVNETASVVEYLRSH